MMAILGCLLGCFWNARNGGQTCDLEAGIHTFNLGHTFNWKPMLGQWKEGFLFWLVALELEPTSLTFQHIQKTG